MSIKPVNGDKPVSLTLNHITSYPLPADLINIYESHPLGKKSIEIAYGVYDSVSQNILPYFKTPYSILAPYLEQADRLGNNTLSSIDDRFPAVKETDLNAARTHAHAVASYPFKVAGQSKSYLLETYQDEYSRSRSQEGLYRTATSIVSTELRIAQDVLHAVAGWLGPRRDEFAQKYEQLRQQAGTDFDKIKQMGAQKLNQFQKVAEQKKEHAEQVGEEKKQELDQKTQEITNGQ